MSEAQVLTNDVLKAEMTDAMVFRGICMDLDSTTTPGIWQTIASTQGTLPPVMKTLALYAILEVMCRAGWVFQRLTSEDQQVAIRTRTPTGTWKAWKEVVFQ